MIDPGTYRLWLAGIILASLALQFGLLWAGVERFSADESARALIAHGLTWANLLEPYIWPPFTKLVVGFALKLHDDVFLVPRLLSGAAGLLTLLAVARLAGVAFGDRRVQLVAAAMAALLPFRLLFSIAPMSDIYYALFLLLAAAPALRWLRGTAGPRALFGACAWVLLAETVRYEATLFAACLGLLVLWRWWRGEGVSFGTLLGAGLLLGSFPVFWVVDSLAWYGSLETLGLAGRQYRALVGDGRLFALEWQPLGRPLLLELAWNPASLLGFAALGSALRRDRALRAWAFAFWLPLLLTSVMMVATLSLPLAVIWRSFGAWSLLLLPWTGFALLRLADRGRERLGRPGLVPILPALAAAALLLPAARDAELAWRDGRLNAQTGHLRQEHQIGLALRDMIEHEGGGHILVDASDNLDFLDVITGSGVPDRFVTSAAADPTLVANYLPTRGQHLHAGEEAILERYLSDHFNLARGGDPAALRQQDIRLLLVHDADFRRALDGSALVERVPREWQDWVLYRMAPKESRRGE